MIADPNTNTFFSIVDMSTDHGRSFTVNALPAPADGFGGRDFIAIGPRAERVQRKRANLPRGSKRAGHSVRSSRHWLPVGRAGSARATYPARVSLPRRAGSSGTRRAATGLRS
jgi:hypothetical protein